MKSYYVDVHGMCKERGKEEAGAVYNPRNAKIFQFTTCIEVVTLLSLSHVEFHGGKYVGLLHVSRGLYFRLFTVFDLFEKKCVFDAVILSSPSPEKFDIANDQIDTTETQRELSVTWAVLTSLSS